MAWYIRARDIQEHIISMEESSFGLQKEKPLLLFLGLSFVAVTDGYVMWCSNGRSLMKAILIITTGYVQYMLLLQCCCQ